MGNPSHLSSWLLHLQTEGSPPRSPVGLRFQTPEKFQILVVNFKTELARGERASETRKRNLGRVEKYILVEQAFNFLSEPKHTAKRHTAKVTRGRRWRRWERERVARVPAGASQPTQAICPRKAIKLMPENSAGEKSGLGDAHGPRG